MVLVLVLALLCVRIAMWRRCLMRAEEAEWEECAVYCCERGIPSAGQGGLERSKGVSIMQQAIHLAEEMGEKLARRSDMQREMSKTSEA